MHNSTSPKKISNTKEKVGNKGETSCGRVDEKAAAVKGLGTETTDHQRIDGVSLVTPVSSPQLVKPPPSSIKSNTTPTAQVSDNSDTC